jgi:hypothetical protein
MATLLLIRLSGLGRRSTNFEIKGNGTLVTLSSLKLHSVALIKIFDLDTRSETSTMKEYIFATVVRSDKSKSLLSDDFLNRSGHDAFPLFELLACLFKAWNGSAR